MTAQQQEQLLDIRERPNGSVVIKRYPFETVFNSDEVKELEEYFHTRPHTPAPELTFKQPDMQSGYTVEQVAEIDKRIRKERAEAARTATLKTLDEFEEWCKSRYVTQQIRDFKIYKSLRRTAQEQQR